MELSNTSDLTNSCDVQILWAGGLVAVLVLCETCKSLLLLPVFRPFLFSAPRPPLDSLLASAALLSLVAAWFVQGIGGRRGTYAARSLTVASVRWVGGGGVRWGRLFG